MSQLEAWLEGSSDFGSVKAVLFEYCCSSNSEIGTQAGRHGVLVIRLDVTTKLHRPQGIARAIRAAKELCERGVRVHVHAATPCTDWCRWQAINVHKLGPEYEMRLRTQRRRSLMLTTHFRRMLDVVMAFPGSSASKEWPRYCFGWHQRKVRQVIERYLPCSFDFDGCAFGLQSEKGIPLRKPWRIRASTEAFATMREYRCPGKGAHPVHARISGRKGRSSLPTTPRGW